MKSIIMQKMVVFIYNKNIEIVEEIFKGKIPDYMLSHLLDKVKEYQEYRNDNSKAWLDFIGNLDSENSDILFNHINSQNI